MNIIEKMFKVCKNLICSFGRKNPRVMTSEQTIEYVLKNKASIGRYGDGEIGLIDGKSLRFQTCNAELSQRLSAIRNTDNFLVCIPNIFDKKYFNKTILKQQEYKFWKKHKLIYSYLWKGFFNKQINGDALLSRFYIRYNNPHHVAKYVKLFKQLWEGRNIIIIEGATSKIGCENDLLGKATSIRRIICPSSNAYDYYEQILKTVKSNYNDGDLVLIALGPTATVLAYDLSQFNIQALDLGHFDIEYEWFIANAKEKMPVKNKHVNECSSIGDSSTEDKAYNSQIIYKIEEKTK